MPWRAAVASWERMAQNIFSFVIVKRDTQVTGKAQVVIGAAAHPGRQGVAFNVQQQSAATAPHGIDLE
jgi:hypothetical protein